MSTRIRSLIALAVFAFIAGCGSDISGFIGPAGGGAGGGGGGGGGGTGGGGVPGALSESIMFHSTEAGATLIDLKINGVATIAVYASDENPLGQNPGGDTQIFSIVAGNPTPVQITTDTGDGFTALADFDINEAGTEVVFVSNQDLTGNNPNNATNLFLATTDGTTIAQVTTLASGAAMNPRISGDGSTIVFVSQNDLTGGNPLNASQIFAIDSDGNNLRQVTMGAVSAEEMAFSDDGTRIVWEDRSDPFGTNVDGSVEIFAIDFNGTNHMQLTTSIGDSITPRISDDGAFVLFASAAEFTPGSNADGFLDVYVARGDGTGTVRITDDAAQPSGADFNGASGLDISGNGLWVVFASWADIQGINTDNTYTIYWANADGTQVQQLLRDETKPVGVSSRFATLPVMSNDGGTIVFEGQALFATGAPAGGHKIYSHIRE